MGIITFLTDFGTSDSYVSQMKGVVLSITDTRIIDITHEIKPQDINEGAFVLQNVVKYFPIGTVHVAVVDPEVGSNRKGIIVTTINQIFVGPDNGLLIPAARNLGDFIVYEITNEKYMLNSISSTFHGRDIFSPVAANIINGVPFERIGKRIKNFFNLEFEKAKIENRLANGKILHIDKFGNIDILINNAGVAPDKRIDILNTTPESFDRVFSINALGPFFLTQLVAKHMIEQIEKESESKNCIIFISSISAYVSSPSRAEYCISKTAISHTVRMFAHRLAEFGIMFTKFNPE